MHTLTVGDYEAECSGVRVPNDGGWAAQLTVYGPSPNPMHRNCLVRDKRVSIGTVFRNETDAEDEAHRVALTMMK